MQNSLNTTSGQGTQTSTQNPQTATTNDTLNSPQSNIQSSSVNLFNNTNGVSLTPPSLPTVKLQASKSTTSYQPIPTVKHHHVNGILLGIVLAVFLAAMAIFWRTTINEKNTTE